MKKILIFQEMELSHSLRVSKNKLIHSSSELLRQIYMTSIK